MYTYSVMIQTIDVPLFPVRRESSVRYSNMHFSPAKRLRTRNAKRQYIWIETILMQRQGWNGFHHFKKVVRIRQPNCVPWNPSRNVFDINLNVILDSYSFRGERCGRVPVTKWHHYKKDTWYSSISMNLLLLLFVLYVGVSHYLHV